MLQALLTGSRPVVVSSPLQVEETAIDDKLNDWDWKLTSAISEKKAQKKPHQAAFFDTSFLTPL